MEDRAFRRLASEHLVLRRFRDADAEALAAYRDDPEVARYQGWDRPYPLTEARTFIAGLHALSPGRPGTWFQFAVERRDAEGLIGDVALRTTDDDPPRGEVGFTFATGWQGQGHATEALQALVDYALGTLGLAGLFAVTDARNRRARRLLQRVGFELERELENGECRFRLQGPRGSDGTAP